MKTRNALKILVGIGTLMACTMAIAQGSARLYHWVDDEGVTHYGDRIPPQYATKSHNVLNKQGVEVKKVAGQRTAEEINEEKRLIAEAEQEARDLEDARLRDRVLLSTYLSVDEIEALRDRRVELLAGQIRVTQLYLDNLRTKLAKLEREAKRYSPYNTDPKAKPIDEKLTRELSDTLDSIMLYEENLATSKNDQVQLMAKFDSDINRFRELRSLN